MDSKRSFCVITNRQERVDAFLSHLMDDYSRSLIKKWITESHITVNDKPVKARYALQYGDRVTVDPPPEEHIDVEPQPIPLDIIYEDADIIVVNKPPGMVVHPAPGHTRDTLVNALLYHCTDLSTINGVIRPGIVHRLDKDTSGVLLVAKNDASHTHLARQFAGRTLSKVYCAIVAGQLRAGTPTTIDQPIGRHAIHRKKMSVREHGGKEAHTEYKIIFTRDDYSFIKVYIKTGRTHQIRVHLAHIGFPIIGDKEYGSSKQNHRFEKLADRQMLHAYALRIKHPATGQQMLFRARIPSDMRNFLHKTRSL